MTTMLIVDDEMDMRMLVRVVIEMVNHGLSIVGEAADGDEAIQVLAGPRRPPDPRRGDPRQPHARAHRASRWPSRSSRSARVSSSSSTARSSTTRCGPRPTEVGIARVRVEGRPRQPPDVVQELTAA